MSVALNVGDVFTWLTIIEIEYGVRGGRTYVCKCRCGNVVKYEKDRLVKGHNKSCGCKLRKHSMAGTRIYQIWSNMKKRCENPKATFYDEYGGRGITFCEKWRTFEGFYEDMNEGYADELTLDRIDVNGDYTKENCRWVDVKTQMNNMRSNKRVEYEGETYTLSQFAEKFNLDYHLFRSRILRGFSLEKAMEPQWIGTMTYKGETKTVREFAEEYGMSYRQLKKRLMWGWDVERALNQPIRRRKT